MKMKYFLFCLLILLSVQVSAFAQCNDKPKIEFGGDFGFVDYMFNCPSYSFAYNGDTSKNWGVLNNHIDIRQAPTKVLVYKKMVEKTIKSYAGDKFFSDLKFYDVDVNYPEKFQAFKDSGRTDMLHKYSKAKYFYYYRFGPNDTASYLIGVAVNKNGKIISPFTFPSKKYYRPIDKAFTYCKLIDIARKTQKDIDPIEDIRLEYDSQHGRFYWLISRKLVNETEGTNYIHQVEINAANLADAKAVESQVLVQF
jgi:hypothetical protein